MQKSRIKSRDDNTLDCMKSIGSIALKPQPHEVINMSKNELHESITSLVSKFAESNSITVPKASQLSASVSKSLLSSGVLDSITKNTDKASKLGGALSVLQKSASNSFKMPEVSSSTIAASQLLAKASASCKLNALKGFPIKINRSLLDAISASDKSDEKEDYIELDPDTYNAINDNLVSIPTEETPESDSFQFGKIRIRRDTFFFIISLLVTILSSFPGVFVSDVPSQSLPHPTEIQQERPSPEEEQAPDDRILFVAVQTSETEND